METRIGRVSTIRLNIFKYIACINDLMNDICARVRS